MKHEYPETIKLINERLKKIKLYPEFGSEVVELQSAIEALQREQECTIARTIELSPAYTKHDGQTNFFNTESFYCPSFKKEGGSNEI